MDNLPFKQYLGEGGGGTVPFLTFDVVFVGSPVIIFISKKLDTAILFGLL